jgi:hypothetical protein
MLRLLARTSSPRLLLPRTAFRGLSASGKPPHGMTDEAIANENTMVPIADIATKAFGLDPATDLEAYGRYKVRKICFMSLFII